MGVFVVCFLGPTSNKFVIKLDKKVGKINYMISVALSSVSIFIDKNKLDVENMDKEFQDSALHIMLFNLFVNSFVGHCNSKRVMLSPLSVVITSGKGVVPRHLKNFFDDVGNFEKIMQLDENFVSQEFEASNWCNVQLYQYYSFGRKCYNYLMDSSTRVAIDDPNTTLHSKFFSNYSN